MSETAKRPQGSKIAGLFGRKIRFFGFDLQITDTFVLWGLIIQAALFFMFGRRINQPLLLAAKNAGLAALYIVVTVSSL